MIVQKKAESWLFLAIIIKFYSTVFEKRHYFLIFQHFKTKYVFLFGFNVIGACCWLTECWKYESD